MIEFDNDAFSKLLYDICWEQRLGSNELARECGVSAATMSRIISKRKSPDVTTLARILNYAKKDFATFIKEIKGP